MFVSYSVSYDWLLLARLKHCHKGTYYGYKLTHAQTFVSGVFFFYSLSIGDRLLVAKGIKTMAKNTRFDEVSVRFFKIIFCPTN